MVRVVAVADTHGMHEQPYIPDGDIFIHAGDFTARGSFEDVDSFDRFLATLPHRHKIVIAGNHDLCFEAEPARARSRLTHATYLEDQAATVAGLHIWGSPWQPWFYDWAFNLPRGRALREKWDLIPDETDILLTHGPPMGWLDVTVAGQHAGCEELTEAVLLVKPRLHVFGHIHEGAGVIEEGPTIMVNASICTARYQPINSAVVIDL
jgi:calcineurin-like phosphoesterase family protein